MKADNCNHPALGRQVFEWAMLRSGIENEPQNDTLREHIRGCAACREVVGQWKRKGETARVLADCDRVLRGKLDSNERLDERAVAEGRVLFKYFEREPNTGMLILVNSENRLVSVNASASRQEFEATVAYDH